MLVFFIKQMLSLKRAILGRREPHQLAWGLALGVLLGIVPHGNLIALTILLLILSLRVNHGMVAVTAVATSVFAALLDAQTHVVGKYVLTHPNFAPQLSAAWQWPLVPWTDINNTIVMGGLLLGLAAVVPTYLLSYPLFRYLAPPAPDQVCEEMEQPAEWSETTAVAGDERPAALVVPASPIAPPIGLRPAGDANPAAGGIPTTLPTAAGSDHPADRGGTLILRPLAEAETTAIDAVFRDDGIDDSPEHVEREPQPTGQQAIDTRIEVVRLVEVAANNDQATHKPATSEPATHEPAALPEPEQTASETSASETSPGDPPTSEALNYLLRQLRDSRQRRAA